MIKSTLRLARISFRSKMSLEIHPPVFRARKKRRGNGDFFVREARFLLRERLQGQFAQNSISIFKAASEMVVHNLVKGKGYACVLVKLFNYVDVILSLICCYCAAVPCKPV
jgi:hypothetical protein